MNSSNLGLSDGETADDALTRVGVLRQGAWRLLDEYVHAGRGANARIINCLQSVANDLGVVERSLSEMRVSRADRSDREGAASPTGWRAELTER